MSTSGNFQSFNYGVDDSNYHHLPGQDYAVCFRREKGHCTISYVPADDGESFYLSQKPSNSLIKSLAGETKCGADFVIIPGGSNAKNGQGTCQVSCKNSFYDFAIRTPLFRALPQLCLAQLLTWEDIVAED